MIYVGSVTDKTLTPYVLWKDLCGKIMFVRFPFYDGWDNWPIEVVSLDQWLENPDITKFPLP